MNTGCGPYVPCLSMRCVWSVRLVQVTRLAPMGALAREKDLIVEFDDSERRAALEEDLLAVEQIDEQIKKAKADLAIRDNQDQVDLLKARYAVRRAELEVKRNPILSAIDAKKNLLNLEEARRRLKQLESDIKSRQAQAQAELAVFDENREQEHDRRGARKAAHRAGQGALAHDGPGGRQAESQRLLHVRAADAGYPRRRHALAGYAGGGCARSFRAGSDGQSRRTRPRQSARRPGRAVSLDAVPEKQFHGKIKSMSGTASANVFSGDPAKKFDVVFGIDMRQLLTDWA